MEKLTPIDKLDIVLNFLDSDKISGQHLSRELFDFYNKLKLPEIDGNDFDKILEKLVTDKHLSVSRYEVFSGHFNSMY